MYKLNFWTWNESILDYLDRSYNSDIFDQHEEMYMIKD